MIDPARMSIISVQNLNVTLNDHHILLDVSFEIEKGSITAIVGQNGSGKTTLLKAMLGFIPYRGEISVLGHSPRQLHRIASKIGYVPQRLDFDRTIPVTVRELLSIHSAGQEDPAIREALALVGAGDLLDKRLGVLSGGQFQRVLIALALLNRPEILFLDEPAASIDVEGAGELYELLRTLKEEKHLTILLVSHDIDVVYGFTDSVLCINHRLLCSGVPHEALTKETMEKLYGRTHAIYPHKEKRHV